MTSQKDYGEFSYDDFVIRIKAKALKNFIIPIKEDKDWAKIDKDDLLAYSLLDHEFIHYILSLFSPYTSSFCRLWARILEVVLDDILHKKETIRLPLIYNLDDSINSSINGQYLYDCLNMFFTYYLKICLYTIYKTNSGFDYKRKKIEEDLPGYIKLYASPIECLFWYSDTSNESGIISVSMIEEGYSGFPKLFFSELLRRLRFEGVIISDDRVKHHFQILNARHDISKLGFEDVEHVREILQVLCFISVSYEPFFLADIFGINNELVRKCPDPRYILGYFLKMVVKDKAPRKEKFIDYANYFFKNVLGIRFDAYMEKIYEQMNYALRGGPEGGRYKYVLSLSLQCIEYFLNHKNAFIGNVLTFTNSKNFHWPVIYFNDYTIVPEDNNMRMFFLDSFVAKQVLFKKKLICMPMLPKTCPYYQECLDWYLSDNSSVYFRKCPQPLSNIYGDLDRYMVNVPKLL